VGVTLTLLSMASVLANRCPLVGEMGVGGSALRVDPSGFVALPPVVLVVAGVEGLAGLLLHAAAAAAVQISTEPAALNIRVMVLSI